MIELLTKDFEAKRQAILAKLLGRLNGKLDEDDRKYIEGAFRLYQNQILHGPITAVTEESHAGPSAPGGHTLLGALLKLFRLEE